MTALLASVESHDVSELRVAPDHSIDLDAATRAVFDLLVALGQDPTSDDLAQTPRRVAAALAESLTPAGARTVTSALTGLLRDDPAARSEFSSLITAAHRA